LHYLDTLYLTKFTPLYPKYGNLSPASDDGSSPLITLEQGFVYFGRTYHQVYVNQNGHLTFEIPWGRYIPLKFPMNGPEDIIAPFWTDLDNRQKGRVTYIQHTSGSVLQQATTDINEYFPYFNPFVATWVFVATWDGVPYYPNKGDGSTFQVVLIRGGNLSFVLMNYDTIQAIDLYNTPQNVQAGFDTIKSTQYFSIPGSFSAYATGPNSSFCLGSNVNRKGRWAFRIDQEQSGGKNMWSESVIFFLKCK
uniref:NIDO domain-containing protein n=1 Tax=Neogobius melanostomus TaxID=47308 RepID=A0A8C6SWX4_9GOBI